LYLISQLLRIYPDGTASAFELTITEARQVLAITSGFGQIVLFTGLVTALWRANLAAGLSGSGVRGLAFGAAGVGILMFLEAALLLDWIGFPVSAVGLLVRTTALDAGIIAGTALVFAGLASLGVGLSQAIDLFGRAERAQQEIPPSVSGAEETV
jgi:hypothetical protein